MSDLQLRFIRGLCILQLLPLLEELEDVLLGCVSVQLSECRRAVDVLIWKKGLC